VNDTKGFSVRVGLASLLLLTGTTQAGAQSCQLAPPGSPSGQSCPPVTQISIIATGESWPSIFPPSGPWIEFAVPHSVLTNDSSFIQTGGVLLCGTIPNPIAAPICTATVTLEIMQWQQADQGQGVFATLWWDSAIAGVWTFVPVPSNNCPTQAPQLHGPGDWCNVNSDCQSGLCMQNPCNTSGRGGTLCGVASCLGNSPYFSIQAADGLFLSAANSGGLSGPNGALNTNRIQAQSWETFSCHLTVPNQLALQTANGQWVTAVNGGSIGGPNADPYEIQTNRPQAQCWETFKISTTDGLQCTLMTNSGNYVTAVNGGGVGGNDTQNSLPIHTNATQQGAWETFKLTPGQNYLPYYPTLCPNNGVCCGRPDPHGNCDGVCVAAGASCSAVTGYPCASNQQCCGTVDSHGICSGKCVASNASCQ
jgi:hypothetical protein